MNDSSSSSPSDAAVARAAVAAQFRRAADLTGTASPLFTEMAAAFAEGRERDLPPAPRPPGESCRELAEGFRSLAAFLDATAGLLP